ncbi:MAG TPA: alpha/beta hydrolase [Cyclobacteriaceae bacterium]|nr:alpha/beta hydrolase [Cyclobacteriaceae bacterium]
MDGLKRPYSIFLLCCVVTVEICAQTDIPRDTTYTVWSTHQKLKKQYPQIIVVKPIESPNITQRFDVPYIKVNYSGGARELKADLFYPRKIKKNLPAVVMVHGGGWRSGDKSMNTPLAQLLAMHGYFVMSVEYQLSLEAKYPAAVYNLKAAVRWLRSKAQEFQIKENYIAIIGGSAGGQLASLIGATNGNPQFEGNHGYPEFSSEVQAVVDLDGLLDFTDRENLEMKRTVQSADVFWLEGHYDSISDKWREASALYQVSKKSPPYLFINSSQKRFHAGYKAMVAQLASMDIKSEVIELKTAPHSYWFFEPWFTPMKTNIISFLNQTSKNK